MLSAVKMLASAALCFAAAIAFPASGWAQESGGYLGGSLGQAKYAGGAPCPGECDNADTAWRIFAGYQFNRYFSTELGYADLGQTSARNIFAGGGITFFTTGTLDSAVTAWDLVGVGALPLSERFSLFGRLGMYQADVKNRRSNQSFSSSFGPSPGSPIGAPVVAESSVNPSGVAAGLGARYDFTRHLGVRAEWQRYSKVDTGASARGEIDVDLLSVGLLYRF